MSLWDHPSPATSPAHFVLAARAEDQLEGRCGAEWGKLTSGPGSEPGRRLPAGLPSPTLQADQTLYRRQAHPRAKG